MKSGIYKISFDKGRLFYIGSAVDLKKRKNNHLSDLNKKKHCNRHLQNVYNKHGMFDFEILENCNKDYLIKREQHYLDTMKPNLNILKVAFSSIGYKHKKETIDLIKEQSRKKAKCSDWRKKVSKGWFKKGNKPVPQTKETIEKRVKKFTGYKHTEEAREKMSKKAKARDYSKIDISKFIQSGIDASKKPVKQIKENGDVVNFNSMTDALKQFKTKQSRHLKNAIATSKTYKKSKWFFIEKT
tara:strand:- start:145 stop:870 length:726 start_codon:yes stop_codon:yes gene_type:complete